jgi:phosphoenolpyruvate carboxykinase (GTP)
MLPFCGYHVGDYFKHWLVMGDAVAYPPRIFSVNWFRKDEDGKFVWPGFGQNMRVLQWVVERCRGRAHAVENAVGLVPEFADLDWTGTQFDAARFAGVMQVRRDEWERELASHDALFAKLGAKLPLALQAERERLAGRLAT